LHEIKGVLIWDKALEAYAYLTLFDDFLTDDGLVAVLAFFGWQPDALPWRPKPRMPVCLVFSAYCLLI
jgi:hypothetical protein